MSFNYSLIPEGYYDKVLTGPLGIRKFWHYHKFESVLRYIPKHLTGPDKAILDIGCFAGSFLGMVPSELFGYQLGVDILENQILYASNVYGTEYREFKLMAGNISNDPEPRKKFDIVTLIEVVEHLSQSQIAELFSQIKKILKPSGKIIITTPNYSSVWPLLELIINNMSDVKYEEQHITKFNYFNIDKKLQGIIGESNFFCEKKTTTHFLTPYIATFSYPLATKLAQGISSYKWKNPFGSIIISIWGGN